MANEQKPEESEQINGGSDATGTGIVGRLKAKYRAVRDDIKTYPEVWASYTAVYGTFGLYLAYRLRKLRQTEDRIRALQEELRARYQAEESAASAAAASSENVATSARAGSTSEKASTSARATSTSATPPDISSSDISSSSANVGKTPK